MMSLFSSILACLLLPFFRSDIFISSFTTYNPKVRRCFLPLPINAASDSNDERVMTKSLRTVVKLEKYARLPIWPLWNGIFLYLLSKLPFVPPETVAELEASIGGRVCPNFFPQVDDLTFSTSPFIMLVHHVHTFHPFDPFRFIQRYFFPEGFPAHPHRGFCTITYCLHGGMIHRDSMGVRQNYGASRDYSTQLLVAGKGVLHEEIWDTVNGGTKQELFQLWVNLPAKYKMIQPSIQLLTPLKDSMPTVIEYESIQQNQIKTCSILVIAGSYMNQQSAMTLFSNLTILHVTLFQRPNHHKLSGDVPNASWTYHLPIQYRTAIIYVRSGAIELSGTTIPPHHTAYLSQTGDAIDISLTNGSPSHPLLWPDPRHDREQDIGADFIVLAGAPLNEPVVAQGSMVMNSNVEINQAYQDYQEGLFGLPWKESLSDEEWQSHVKMYGVAPESDRS